MGINVISFTVLYKFACNRIFLTLLAKRFIGAWARGREEEGGGGGGDCPRPVNLNYSTYWNRNYWISRIDIASELFLGSFRDYDGDVITVKIPCLHKILLIRSRKVCKRF